MLPLLIALGVGALIIDEFSNEKKVIKRRRKNSNTIKRNKNIFISFPVEDMRYRDFLVSQAKNKKSPFTFSDMSVKEPWKQEIWKRMCREKIKGCDGMIVLLSKNSWHSGGSRWEVKCAREEGVRVAGMHIFKNEKGAIPIELKGKRVMEWSWNNLEKFVNDL